METNLQGFHEDEQFSTNSLLSSNEVMKYQLKILESKPQNNILWQESVMNEGSIERDFQQIMSDWQNHVGSLQIPEPDVDVPLDILSSDILLSERSPILSKALNSPSQKMESVLQPTSDISGIKKEPMFENDPCSLYQKTEQKYFSGNVSPDILGIKKEPMFENSSCSLFPKILNSGQCFSGNQVFVASVDSQSPYKRSATLSGNHCLMFGYSQHLNTCKKMSKTRSILVVKSCNRLLKFTLTGIKKESILENGTLYQSIQNDKKYFNGNIKCEPTVVRKLTLLNGEKEILGKNIIGLHSLNVIKENPDQNCQITSTVINGKKYKIIIKPKSQKLQKYNEEKIKKSLIKKLSRCNLAPKIEPKEDELISEMRNGNYDVPILGNDNLLSWDMACFDNAWDNTSDNVLSDISTENKVESPKKVPPLKIKIQKGLKYKKKRMQVKSDEEIDVETIGDKLENNANDVTSGDTTKEVKGEISASENIQDNLPKKVVDVIESLKRKKDGRIPLVQVIPKKMNFRSGTRMQDAAVVINRNKLLKIVSGNDAVQLDHDYCSSTFNNFEIPRIIKIDPVVNLKEKNPKKDSGMESGDVSDASEDPQTPENVAQLNSFQQINNKLIEQRKSGKTNTITKVAADLFRAANVITSNTNVNNSDVVKTLIVSNGNKPLTNNGPVSTSFERNGDKCDIVPSGSSEIFNHNDVTSKTDVEGDKPDVSSNDNSQLTQLERPKKKLKLEEYLSRRNSKVTENRPDSNMDNGGGITSENKVSVINDSEGSTKTNDKTVPETTEPKEVVKESEVCKEEKSSEDSRVGNNNDKNSERHYGQRSPSTSSVERDGRRDRERSPGSRSPWRESRRDYKSRHKHRNSSGERRRSFWSRSLSRSSSRESSSSSDRSGGGRIRKSSPLWYRRRSGSRSISRERSRSRNRSYSDRRPQNRYYSRDFYSRRFAYRSRSPYRNYSVREKQKQIEERRVIYVGRIEEGMTNAKLRERFGIFGPILDISLHFREYGDNYGFVTYAYKDDAYDAVEHGNDNPSLPRYDLCFGGRRGFCRERYADLDGMPTSYSGFQDRQILQSPEESFDLLLKKAQAKLKKRISKTEK